MQKLILWMGIAFLFSVSLLSAAEFRGLKCYSYHSPMLGHEVKYCLHRSRPDLAPQKGEKVVYFMHGIWGSAQSWEGNGYAEALDILSKEEPFPAITFISFDTEGTSFFSDPGSMHNCSNCYESWLINEFMPKMETTYDVCRERSCRALAGISMGGYGALKTALRHSGLFFMAAANSQALMPFGLYESDGQWLGYFNRHPVGALKGMPLMYRVRSILPNAQYAAENDPATLVQSFWDRSRFPVLYFDVGGNDYYGFQEGFFRLKSALDARGYSATTYFEPQGTHDLPWDRRWWLIRFVRDHF